MSKLKYWLIALIGLAAIFLIVNNFQAPKERQEPSFGQVVFENGKSIKVEIADTEQKRNQGLSDREPIDDDFGMLFIFQEKKRHPFWMKGMRFALDFIWLDEGKIVDLHQNVEPTLNSLPIIQPDQLIDRVLEVQAGFIADNEVKIGNKLEIQLP